MELPKNLKFSPDYVWVSVENNIASLGVTEYGLKAAKEIVFIDLPKLGPITKGDDIFSLESVKWSGHLVSPVSGEVIEVNEPIFDEPEALNKDPYGTWICKVKLSNPDELNMLMDSKTAQEWVEKNLG